MNTLKNVNPLVLAIVALIVGLILGLIIFWGIVPPRATDVAPVDLHPGYRDFYLALVATEYNNTHDLALAKTELGADKDWSSRDIAAALRKLASAPGRGDTPQLEALATDLEASAPTPKVSTRSNSLLIGCLVLILLVLIVVGVLVLLPRLRAGGAPRAPLPAAVRTAQASKAVEPTSTVEGEPKPLAQFVTTYEIGDDRYDTSFSVETSSGDFLGECGVGISETIGTGSPDKVTAYEVWLFDKNDIRTVTKVLMSEYAYGDATLRAKLAPKGEPELARPDAVIELETASLAVHARVVEMEYGTGELPPHSFFNKLVLELKATAKEMAAAPAT